MLSETVYEPKSLNYLQIEEITENILKKNLIKKPPVPVKDLIEDAGVDVVFTRFKKMGDKIAGFTDFKEKKIYINAEDNFNRQIFTMAHEYGHWILHKSLFEINQDEYRVLLRTNQITHDPLEREANAFAASLLVPEFLIKPVKDHAKVKQLAQIFAVSPEAMSYRLKHV